MGIMDFFKSKDKSGIPWSLQRKMKKALNKFIQAPERQGALRDLVQDASDPALTTDETEKEYVHDSLVAFGARIIPFLVESIKTGDSIQWQLNIYKELVSEEDLLQSLLGIIAEFDTEYEKNPQRKIQIIEALGEWKSPMVVEALARFLDDVDETVRYATVGSMLEQDPELMRDKLLQRALEDESNRIRDLVIDGFLEKEIPVKGFQARKQFEEKLPPEMFVDSRGLIRKKGPKAR
jgi:hypothetical protein